MKRILAIIFMVLLVPSLGIAQDWNWTATADVLWVRPTINWHDDEMSLKGKATLGQFGIMGSSPLLSASYFLTTGFGTVDTITPQAALFVGSTNFGKDPTQTGQQGGQDKPISLEWSMTPSSRIEIGGPLINSLRPLMVCEWSSVTLTGSKDDSGKEKRETETLRGSFYGIGGEISVGTFSDRGFARIAASDRYLLGDIGFVYAFNRWGAINAGYSFKTLRFDKGTTVRINAGYAGIEVPLRLP